MAEILICGGLLIDRYLQIDKYPWRGGDGYILDSFDVVGGCAVNIAKTVKNLGAKPYIVSFVGNDSHGDKIMGFMQEEQFDLDCVRRTDGNTGYCFVFLEPDGERTFLTYKGCETEYTDELIPKGAADSCTVAAVTGYYLLDSSSRILVGRLKKLKKRGVKIVFDPSPLVDKIEKSCLEDILSISDVITPNETEAEYLAGFEKGDAAVIITRGADGGTLYEKVKTIHYKAAVVDVVDTTGAGDSFTGAIAWALAKGIPLEKGVLVAASAAGYVASIKGPHGDFDIEV